MLEEEQCSGKYSTPRKAVFNDNDIIYAAAELMCFRTFCVKTFLQVKTVFSVSLRDQNIWFDWNQNLQNKMVRTKNYRLQW